MTHPIPVVMRIAAMAHEVNRAYCLSHGDESHQSWEDTPKLTQDSVISGVVAHLEDPTLTPAHSHALWMTFKLDEGWVYGEKKDYKAKTHPCLVNYNDLPPEQKAKDFIFRAVVHGAIVFQAMRSPGPHSDETRGGYKVGISVNPSSLPMVDDIKERAAALIDLVADEPYPDPDPLDSQSQHIGEIRRLRALAMTAFEDGAMWAVKATTKRPPARMK